MTDSNSNLLKPNDAETRALLNLVINHSLKIVKHWATHRTRTNITNSYSDTYIAVFVVDAQDSLHDFDKFPAFYAKNGHDVIKAHN